MSHLLPYPDAAPSQYKSCVNPLLGRLAGDIVYMLALTPVGTFVRSMSNSTEPLRRLKAAYIILK